MDWLKRVTLYSNADDGARPGVVSVATAGAIFEKTAYQIKIVRYPCKYMQGDAIRLDLSGTPPIRTLAAPLPG